MTAFFGEKVSFRIQLQQTPAFLQEIASQSNNWKSFTKTIGEKRRSASKNQIETLNAIEQNVKSLIIEDMETLSLPTRALREICDVLGVSIGVRHGDTPKRSAKSR
ncbi:MAG: hypothetical protein QXN16_03500 [Candidatus Micrarchaeaceae archaeon]